MGNWTRMGAALLLAAAVSLHAEPGKGNHYGTDDNNGNHIGWGDGGNTGGDTPDISVQPGGDNEIVQGEGDSNAPAGQPLPGALAVLALGGLSATVMRRRRSAKRS